MKKIIITISGPTCSGKSSVLNELFSQGIGKPISTTTRPQRVGETHGKDYFFITPEKSSQLERDNEFAELITLNGHRYGILKSEMDDKLNSHGYVAIVVDPNGAEQYKQFAEKYSYNHISFFLDTHKSLRIKRFSDRLLSELTQPMKNEDDNKAREIIRNYFERHEFILYEEEQWENSWYWDVIINANFDSAEGIASDILTFADLKFA